MSDTMKLALQLTAIDMLSGVVERAKRHILSLGPAGQSVKKDFDDMTRHISTALKNVAMANYTMSKIGQGVKPAADLQEEMINVRMSLMRSGKDAATLNSQLVEVKKTAIDISKIAPFSAQDVAGITRELSNAGLELNDITGKRGAAWATTALATVAKVNPEETAKGLVKIGTPFNLQGNQYGELADWMQRTGMHGVAKAPDIIESMGYVAGSAAVKKVPWKDTLTALSVLGEQGMVGSRGGTELNDFLMRLSGTSREERRVQAGLNEYLKAHGQAPLKFWEHGKMKPMLTIIKDMRAAFAGLTDEKKEFVLKKIFEQRGYLAAVALMKEGNGSWEQRLKLMSEAAGLEDLVNERLKGFNASVTTLVTTNKNTLATMFDPMLKPLTLATQKMNDLVAGAGKLADEHPNLTAAGNVALAGTAAYLGGNALWNFGKGGLAGAKVLKGLKGLGVTAAGITEGKIVQAATGVTPVFVTNWPGSGIPGANNMVSDGPFVGTPKPGGFGKYLIPGAMYSLPVAVAAAPFVSKFIGDTAKANGWAAQTFSRDSREYEVMGIGGRRQQPMLNNEVNVDVHFDELARAFTTVNNRTTNVKVDNSSRGDFFKAVMTTEAL